MDNRDESKRWMKDARSDFQRAERCFRERDWQGAIQNAQLTIELCVKAVIAIFEEPDWTHSPDSQLMGLIDLRKEEMRRLGQPMVDALMLAAEDARIAAP